MNLILTLTIENFEDVRKYLSGIPSINDGGCGIAALSMYRWLEKNKNEKSFFICCYTDSENCQNNLSYLGKDKDKLSAPSHCGIEHGNKFLDSRSTIPIVMYNDLHFTNEKGMLELINYGKEWNLQFKKENTKEISKRLGINLSDVFV